MAGMEKVLDIYKQVLDPRYPVVCMDESPRQLISETKVPILESPGRPARHDYEYRRNGVCNIFLACEPLAGKRIIKITEKRARSDWAYFIEDIAKTYQSADKITLIMDNLNTHTAGSLYETFSPQKAKDIWDRFEFIYTPKHGSWLNIAEIELNVLTAQCLNRRIDNIRTIERETCAWQNNRNNKEAKVNWQFTATDARIKLKRLYPTISD